ncbi:MAG: photosystem II reaction center protein PsbN [Flavobacteriales bacterium]|nr:photosystem II reaction center protein PsbN [Flavobacteriales bacterium]
MIMNHYNFDPNITFPISIAVITILLAGYGIYKGFFANQNLTDPWDDHDD